jgi:hypothetical protein
MTQLNGFVAEAETRFSLEMTRTVGGAGGPGTASVADALMQLPSGALSSGEMQTLLKLARQFSGDNTLDRREGDTLTHLVESFAQNGERAFDGAWPFADLNFGKAPGNPLFNGLLGSIGSGIGQALRDYAFLDAADTLLDSASGDGAWISALSGAIAHADLSRLSGSERSELLSMIGVAVADGTVNWPEARSIMDKLDGFVGSSAPSPRPQPSSEAAWSVTQPQNGQSTIDLGTHSLQLNENSSEIWITNKETGERSRIWGDPHFDTDGDGDTDVDFWGTVTLNLEGGTKITINTVPWNGNAEMSVSSQLVITNGDRSIVVSGLDQNSIGDMSVTQGNNGRVLDALYGDGLDLYENPNGQGWLVQDGLWMREVTQADTDATRNQPGTQFDLLPSLYAFSSLAASSFLLGMLSGMFLAQDR